jgi:hypothetical protein
VESVLVDPAAEALPLKAIAFVPGLGAEKKPGQPFYWRWFA